jgi:hypothetical protein
MQSASSLFGATRARNTARSSPATYTAFLRDQTRQGSYCPAFRRWALALGLARSVVLSHILSAARVRATPDGWLTVTPRWLEDGLGVTPERGTRILDYLAALGVIELRTSPEGGPRMRQVRVDVARLAEVIAAGPQEG